MNSVHNSVDNKKDIARKQAAYAAVEEHLLNCQTIGVGSGQTMVHVIDRIAELIRQRGWSVRCIPTSYQAKQLILERGLRLFELEHCDEELDWSVDSADEVDSELNLIKGGGGCLLQEKIVDTAAHTLVIVCDESKYSVQFGHKWKGGIPLEVVPMAWSLVKRRVECQFGGSALLRESLGKLGPVVTDNGNFILDWHFDQQHNWEEVDFQLHQMPGVIETGLFIQLASKIYVGNMDGSVNRLVLK
ncbi:hypothetical protein BOX15_Mlig003457g1 [Macrostomum lignano]|uniref:ribose-5-phosphate isomerase n=1 Tax=Macrostomum lignano TaxID=282301 RepID=A0A267EKT3_9PLAT|nr:hypothetical protein BOX15_Mlig003457g1 [Macrostomum lignano]